MREPQQPAAGDHEQTAEAESARVAGEAVHGIEEQGGQNIVAAMATRVQTMGQAILDKIARSDEAMASLLRNMAETICPQPAQAGAAAVQPPAKANAATTVVASAKEAATRAVVSAEQAAARAVASVEQAATNGVASVEQATTRAVASAEAVFAETRSEAMAGSARLGADSVQAVEEQMSQALAATAQSVEEQMSQALAATAQAIAGAGVQASGNGQDPHSPATAPKP